MKKIMMLVASLLIVGSFGAPVSFADGGCSDGEDCDCYHDDCEPKKPKKNRLKVNKSANADKDNKKTPAENSDNHDSGSDKN